MKVHAPRIICAHRAGTVARTTRREPGLCTRSAHAMTTRPTAATRGARKLQPRQNRPGKAGLANENRPGLGTRRDAARGQPTRDAPSAQKRNVADARQRRKQSALPTPPPNRPEPVEQDPASLEHEFERDTGVSGKSSGV